VAGSWLGTETLGNGWYRIYVQCNGVVVGNSNEFIVYPAGVDVPSATGSVSFFGFQISNQGACGTYVQTIGAVVASQNAETLTIPMNLPPGPSTFYARWVEMGGQARSAGTPRILQIGATASGLNPRLLIYWTSTQLACQWIDAVGSARVSSIVMAAAWGDEVEAVMTIGPNGIVNFAARTNGGAWVSGSPSSANALPAAWQTPQLAFPGYSSSAGLPILGLERWAVLPFVVNNPDEAAAVAR
jgi:hypothetical protein